jgi:hypothetical protein
MIDMTTGQSGLFASLSKSEMDKFHNTKKGERASTTRSINIKSTSQTNTVRVEPEDAIEILALLGNIYTSGLLQDNF